MIRVFIVRIAGATECGRCEKCGKIRRDGDSKRDRDTHPKPLPSSRVFAVSAQPKLRLVASVAAACVLARCAGPTAPSVPVVQGTWQGAWLADSCQQLNPGLADACGEWFVERLLPTCISRKQTRV
jgi:hypothetical protein